MGLIKDLAPINLATEKQKFFENSFSYNPQFEYVRDFSNKVLTKYGLPKKEYLEKAKLEYEDFPFEVKNDMGGYVSEQEIATAILGLCDELKIPALKIIYSTGQTSRCLIDPSKKEVRFRLPLALTKIDLRQILYHEVQTHYLRWLNNQDQPWTKDKNRSAKLWKKTEEGLATYNSMRIGGKKIEAMVALRYSMIDLAQTASFVDVFNYANKYLKDPERSWNNTLRVKRGMTDTSRGGGFTRDLVYYEGLNEIRDWLKNGGKMTSLYWGRIGWQEVDEFGKIVQTENLVYPNFIDH